MVARFFFQPVVEFDAVESGTPAMSVYGNGVFIASGDDSPNLGDHTDYGDAELLTPITRTFTIKNADENDVAGTADLEDLVVTAPDGYTVTAQPTSPVAPGASTTFQIRCDVATEEVFSGEIVISSNVADYTFEVTCDSTSPAISVTGDTNFGSTPVGTPVSEIFTISNPGTAALLITLPITIVGAEASAFTVTVQPTETSPGIVELAAGASTTFTVQADADVVDVFDANISIVNNSSENPKLVAVTVDVSALLYADEFTGTVAAPIPAGNADTRGYRVVNDVENLMTIGSGVLNVPAQASAAWGDEYYRAQPSSGQQYWERSNGKALVAIVNFRHSTRATQQSVGWWTSSTLNASTENSVLTLSDTFRAYRQGSTISDTQSYSANTDYSAVAVWDSTGFHTYVKISGIWHKKWFTPSSVTQAYCGMSNFSSAGVLKSFKIFAIDESLFAPALSISNPSVGNLADLPDGDFLLYLDNITRPSSGDILLRVRKQDTLNYWRKRLYSTGSFSYDEWVAGSGTSRISSSGIINGDNSITIARAQFIAAWRNNTQLGVAYTSANNFLREVQLELNSLGTGGAIANIYAWKARLLTEGALGAELVVNGNFAVDATWIKGTGWSVGSGLASKVAGSASQLSQLAILTVGTYYELVFTVSGFSAGTISPVSGNLAPIAANGTYTLRFVATEAALRFNADSAFVGSIDNVSCKEITFTADALATVLDGLAA